MDKEESSLQKWGIVLSSICHLAKIGAWVYCIKIICEHLVLLANTPTSLEIIMTAINKFEISTKISVGAMFVLIVSNLFYHHIVKHYKKENEWLKKQIDKNEK